MFFTKILYKANKNLINTDCFLRNYIFIYHNGYGIIAAGKGTAKVDIDIENEITEELENCIYLENFMTGVNISSNKIEQYITPSEIRVLLERDFYFSNTKVSLSIEESEKIFDSCKKRFVIL